MATKNKLHRTKEIQKALIAQYLLLAYNAIEAVLALFFGSVSNSIALLSFGFDSLVESASTIITTWRLRKNARVTQEAEQEYEAIAVKFIGYSFIAVAAYTAFESVRKLLMHEIPQPSIPGVFIALASLTVMPLFAKYRHKLGHEIKSNALVADSKQTVLCTYMSFALLAGVALNYVFGWWWADPLAGLVIAALALYEGTKALQGKTCC